MCEAKLRRHAASSFALAATLLFASNAHAFCRTTTIDVGTSHLDDQSCPIDGVPLFLASQCLPYRLLTRDSAVIPNAVLSESLAKAFAAWEAPNPVCTPGITSIELAPVDDAEIVGYRPGERARNVIGVSTVHPTSSGDAMLALATLSFNSQTGEILDVDLELNAEEDWSFGDDPAAVKVDLQSVLTHEVGHMFGFAHAPDPRAVMWSGYDHGTTSIRVLTADEQQAICTVYPNRRQRLTVAGLQPSSPCDLVGGSANGACGDPNILHGCSASPASPTHAPLALVIAALAVLGAIARRRIFEGRRVHDAFSS